MKFLIIGNGRSGTTIIEKIIAQKLSLIALGEIDLLWKRGLKEDSKCGCGALTKSCKFWGKYNFEQPPLFH